MVANNAPLRAVLPASIENVARFAEKQKHNSRIACEDSRDQSNWIYTFYRQSKTRLLVRERRAGSSSSLNYTFLRKRGTWGLLWEENPVYNGRVEDLIERVRTLEDS